MTIPIIHAKHCSLVVFVLLVNTAIFDYASFHLVHIHAFYSVMYLCRLSTMSYIVVLLVVSTDNYTSGSIVWYFSMDLPRLPAYVATPRMRDIIIRYIGTVHWNGNQQLTSDKFLYKRGRSQTVIYSKNCTGTLVPVRWYRHRHPADQYNIRKEL